MVIKVYDDNPEKECQYNSDWVAHAVLSFGPYCLFVLRIQLWLYEYSVTRANINIILDISYVTGKADASDLQWSICQYIIIQLLPQNSWVMILAVFPSTVVEYFDSDECCSSYVIPSYLFRWQLVWMFTVVRSWRYHSAFSWVVIAVTLRIRRYNWALELGCWSSRGELLTDVESFDGDSDHDSALATMHPWWIIPSCRGSRWMTAAVWNNPISTLPSIFTIGGDVRECSILTLPFIVYDERWWLWLTDLDVTTCRDYGWHRPRLIDIDVTIRRADGQWCWVRVLMIVTIHRGSCQECSISTLPLNCTMDGSYRNRPIPTLPFRPHRWNDSAENVRLRSRRHYLERIGSFYNWLVPLKLDMCLG